MDPKGYLKAAKLISILLQDDNEKAIATARTLLEYPQLPLQLRARACMVLGCSDQPHFLHMAKEAVRIAQLALSRCTEPVGDVETQLVANCHTVLKEAQEAYDQAEHEEGELVWQAGDNVPKSPDVIKQ